MADTSQGLEMRRQHVRIQTGTTSTTARVFSWAGNRMCLLSANRTTSHLRTVFAHSHVAERLRGFRERRGVSS